MKHGKTLFPIIALILALAACSVNPATGEKQFAALMPPSQEARVGMDEHQKIIRNFGAPRADDPLQKYVERVGKSLAVNTERSDVSYQFFLLDTPMVNAFALPGGYVYVTRGLLALANSEAELASVLAHEIGHITARHSAERYSHSVLTSLGAMVIAAATDNAGAAQAVGLGSELYLKSYSRQQESQADDLGIRYLSKAGYDTRAMASFLQIMGRHDDLQNLLDGRNGEAGLDYFSTHPRTTDRVKQAVEVAAQYPQAQAIIRHDEYLRALDGLTYGDSERQGFARGQSFYHPAMGFTFTVPNGFALDNQPEQVVALSKETGTVIIFDGAGNPNRLEPEDYLRQAWMKNPGLPGVETVTVNGMKAATVSVPGMVNNRQVTIRLVAVAWRPDRVFRFQIAIPQGVGADVIEDLKRTTYSLRPMTAEEKATIRPYRLKIVQAGAADTPESLAGRMPFPLYNEERFRVLNALPEGQGVSGGTLYKIVVER